MKQTTFEEEITAGIPDILPEHPGFDPAINHAPKRKSLLNAEEKMLAIRNA